MDQFNQTNNLQQAIDDIANGKEEKNDQFGVPPMPPAEGEGVPAAPFGGSTEAEGPSAEQILAGGIAPAEPAAAETPVAGAPTAEVTSAVEAPAAPAAEAPAPEMPAVAAPEAEAPAAPEVAGDLASIRENVIKDLLPLMDKVDSTPEEKFEIYKDAMKTMHDATTIGGAYRTATQFSDETKKADALMDLMKTIDNA